MVLRDSLGELAGCRACPRLAAHLDEIREAHPDYHARPVPAWGSRQARLLMVGLAPGMHGANRTGRPFTGDASGTFLFAALARCGLSSDPDPNLARLKNLRITNAVKCLPPGNRPNAAELECCAGFLRREIAELWTPTTRKPRCVMALGHLAHQAVGVALNKRLPQFRHGQIIPVEPNLWVADSYHPSRQNTNTGRLTAAMLDEVLKLVVGLLHPG
jgi:uracil-DNA glycosylase family 4